MEWCAQVWSCVHSCKYSIFQASGTSVKFQTTRIDAEWPWAVQCKYRELVGSPVSSQFASILGSHNWPRYQTQFAGAQVCEADISHHSTLLHTDPQHFRTLHTTPRHCTPLHTTPQHPTPPPTSPRHHAENGKSQILANHPKYTIPRTSRAKSNIHKFISRPDLPRQVEDC